MGCTVSPLTRLDGGGTECKVGQECDCDNQLDDDGDGLTDCADKDCNGATVACVGVCGDEGAATCSGGVPVGCNARAPVTETLELCFDGVDNDCDGRPDCQEEDCEGATKSCKSDCGTGLERCQDGGHVACNAPLPLAEDCTNGADDDCDQLTDCADPNCEGKDSTSCNKGCGEGVNVCQNGQPVCNARAPVPEQGDQACSNGIDDDCDQFTDCLDPQCAGAVRPCGAGACDAGIQFCGFDGGWQACQNTCDGGACIPTALTETGAQCNNLINDDCNQGTDCSDPDCRGATRQVTGPCGNDTQTCTDAGWTTTVNACNAPTPNCCGSTCVNTTTNSSHCGSCNSPCDAGVCNNSTCCAGQACGAACCTASDCCNNACCPVAGSKCVGGTTCCTPSQQCDGGNCCTAAGSFCCRGQCCSAGQQCTSQGCCNNPCNANQLCCTAGQTCVNNACCSNPVCNGACCPGSTDQCVANQCCPPARSCGTTCCPAGEVCAGGATCCPSSVSFQNDIMPFFGMGSANPAVACVSCHSPVPPTAAGMILDPAGDPVAIRNQLVNTASGTGCSGTCTPPPCSDPSYSAYKRVVPNNPSLSLLYRKPTDEVPPCGDHMPACCGGAITPACGTGALCHMNATEKAQFRKLVGCWILQGAPQN